MASRAGADLVIAGGDLGHVLLHDIEACQHRIGLLVFGLRAGDHALEFAADRRDLALDREHRVLDARGVLAGIAGKAADILRDDGEPFAELTGARRLDRAVHRQHIGLDRHHADAVDDLVDVAADVFEAGDQSPGSDASSRSTASRPATGRRSATGIRRASRPFAWSVPAMSAALSRNDCAVFST